MAHKQFRPSDYSEAAKLAWRKRPALLAFAFVIFCFLLDQFGWLHWLLRFFLEEQMKPPETIGTPEVFIIIALVLAVLFLLHALADKVRRSRLDPQQLRLVRNERRKQIEAIWAPKPDNGTFGECIIVDSEDETYPDTVGREGKKPTAFTATLFGIADFRYLEVRDGWTPVQRDVSSGQVKIVADTEGITQDRLLRIGLIPLEWIDQVEPLQHGLCRIFCRFHGTHGRPYAKMELYNTQRVAGGQIHKEVLVDYQSAIRKSFPFWRRKLFGIGTRVMP